MRSAWKPALVVLALLATSLFGATSAVAADAAVGSTADKKPKVVFILADNVGYGIERDRLETSRIRYSGHPATA